ncbi:MAG TPA: MFS transporter [Ferruginibacter sp.]|nr:MFS transporter [Ferruginibacter sp.]HRE62169.1 MFS transporter [Ferruginibacter sp.]
MQTAPKKVLNGWAMYDWANSVYNLVITTTFFPIYYTEITKAAPFNGVVPFAGRHFVNTALYNYTLAAAYLIVAFILPILTSIADARGNKKRYMQFFCYMGALACSSLYFFTKDSFSFGVIAMMFAAIGFYGSLVFYNSYLPDIAAVEDRDRISARGFSFGYIGSVIMQIVGFLLVVFHKEIPFLNSEGDAVRLTFLLVGIWWIGFAQIPFKRLPKSKPANEEAFKISAFTGGFIELKKVFSQVRTMKVMRRFLAAFFFYNMGVQTVMLVASNFGSKVLNLPSTNLIVTVVLIQLVAIPGAIVLSRLPKLFGNLRVLMGVIILWVAICIYGYFMKTATDFYILAIIVGLVMGGIQSLSRSTFSKLMPETNDTASFFSFYDITEKIAIVIGLTTFAYIEERVDMRTSVLSLIVFFSLGLLFLIYARYGQKNQS